MFGFGKKRRAKQAAADKRQPAPQHAVYQPDTSTGGDRGGDAAVRVDAGQAASTLSMVFACFGVTNLLEPDPHQPQLWLDASSNCAGIWSDEDATTRCVVTGGDGQPLTVNLVVDWHGVIDNAQVDEARRVVNEYNASSKVVRACVFVDADGHQRIRAQLVVACWHGYTVAQAHSWLQLLDSGAGVLMRTLGAVWPKAAMLAPSMTADPATAMLMEGAGGMELAAVEAKFAAFATPGNLAGLMKETTPPVTQQRVAEVLSASFGERVHADAYGLALQAGVLNNGAPVEVSYVVRDAVVWVMGMLPVGGAADAALNEVAMLWSTNQAGAVCYWLADDAGGRSLFYRMSVATAAGLSDEQLTASLTDAGALVADSLMGIYEEHMQ